MANTKLPITLLLSLHVLLLSDCTCVDKCGQKLKDCKQEIIDKLADCYIAAAEDFNNSNAEESVKQAIFDAAITKCDQDHAATQAADEAACQTAYNECVTKCANEKPEPPLVPIPDPNEFPPLV